MAENTTTTDSWDLDQLIVQIEKSLPTVPSEVRQFIIDEVIVRSAGDGKITDAIVEQVLNDYDSSGKLGSAFVQSAQAGKITRTFSESADGAAVHTVSDAELFRKMASGEQLSEAEQTQIGQKYSPSDAERMAREIAARISQPVGWVFVTGGLNGLAPDAVDWAGMYDTAVKYYGDLLQFDTQRIEGDTEEEFKRRSIMSLLSTGAGELNQAIVQSYAEEIGHWGTQLMDGKFKVADLRNIANNSGIEYHQVKRLGMSGAQYGMDLERSVRVWLAMQENGLTADLVSGSTRMNLSPEEAEKKRRAGGNLDTKSQARTSARKPKRTRAGGTEIPDVLGKLAPWLVYKRFSESYDSTGSEIVATVAVADKLLARRLYTDPYSLSAEELQRVDKLIQGAGKFVDIQGETAAANWIQSRLQGGREVVRVDLSGAKEAARTLASSWNMPQLSDAQLESLAMGTVAPQLEAYKATLGNPFKPYISEGPQVVNAPSPYAAAAEAMRRTGTYQELFTNKPSGQSEEQYANRFSSEVTQLLGQGGQDPALARTGMRTGDQNTVGQAVLSSGAGSDNSTFRQRLAVLGDAFRGAT